MNQSCFTDTNWLQVVADLVAIFEATISKVVKLQAHWTQSHSFWSCGSLQPPFSPVWRWQQKQIKKSQQWWQSLWLIQSSTDLRYTITTSVLGTLFKLLCLPPFFFLLKASRQSICSYEVIQVFRFSLFSLHYCSVFTIKYKASWCHCCCCDLELYK